MSKAFYNYVTEGTVFSHLMDTALATAMGQTPAAVGTPRIPHKIKPGKIAFRRTVGVDGEGNNIYKYTHAVADEGLQATKASGDTMVWKTFTWTIVGFDGEVNNAFSAY